MLNVKNNNEDITLKERIKRGTALYYYRSTPFTEHGEFNYDGQLTEEFFFENLFSENGRCLDYIAKIEKTLNEHSHKSILLIGNQGCGKTTFVHHLSRTVKESTFQFFDFDKETSNPTLAEYIEILSSYLLSLLKSDGQVNKVFYDLYIRNKKLINKKINGENKVTVFFDDFKTIFLKPRFLRSSKQQENFIININGLFFNQILSLIILWHMCKFKRDFSTNGKIEPMIFCFDNLDVLVNKEIIEKFFKEYFIFVRNVDSIIQNIKDDFFNDKAISYNQLFAFVFCCRQHTWARVREHYRHSHSFVRISTLELNITDAFEKKEVLLKRAQYISDNESFYETFSDDVFKVKALLADMDTQEERGHNIYDLFDDDYRQCNITFDELIRETPELLEQYLDVKGKSKGMPLYGARGVIYKALFDKFKEEGILNNIGVLDINANQPLVSNARLLLNYLNYHTYVKDRTGSKIIPFGKIVEDFKGIISEDDINRSLIAMFKLGDDSCWNELVAFKEIHSEKVETCEGLDIFITKAGHEYLSFIATHFEFFNARVVKERDLSVPLFDANNISKNKDEKYNFQEVIENVIEIVENCCIKMSKFYANYMVPKYGDKGTYLKSPFVYGDVNVLHGERIIHTHIRYIDCYRIYLLSNLVDESIKKDVNKVLTDYIMRYIVIGESNPHVLTDKSIKTLFPVFKNRVKLISVSDYEDYSTRIDIRKY